VSTDVGVQVSSLAPGLSANFDDTASNAVSSMLSGLKRLGNFWFYVNSWGRTKEDLNCTHKNGQEEKQESKKQDKSGF